jgi:hypothetical protein
MGDCVYCGMILPGGAQGNRHLNAAGKAYIEGGVAAKNNKHENPYALKGKPIFIRNCKRIAWQRGHDYQVGRMNP